MGDALHNFLGGVAIGGIFLVDFGVLARDGWSRGNALLFNLFSGFTFLVGGLIAYGAFGAVDLSFLIPFAAGNFLYIGATDLAPELHRHATSGRRIEDAAAFAAGLALLWWLGGVGTG